MNAWKLPAYGEINDLQYGNYADPDCLDDLVLVQIKAAALNPADLKLISGKDGGKFMHAPNFPIIPGFDFSGVITKTGAAIRDLKEGQEVFGFLPYSKANKQGTLADFVVVNSDQLALKPPNVSHAAAAAAATTGSTALQGLRDKGALIGGQHILINGASGGVGSFAVQIAKQKKTTVWGTCSEENIAFVESLGADQVVDYRKIKISELDKKFDIIFDAASSSSFSASQSRLKRGGAYITLLPSFALATGFLRSFFSTKTNRFVIVKSSSTDLAQIAEWLRTETLTSQIGASYKMHEAKEGLKHLARGVTGKIVIINE